jgi:acyl-CoA thioester hydrolase
MRFEIPEDKKHVHDMTIPVRWGDMDALQHVNNTVYFRFIESSRVEWLRTLGAFKPLSDEGPVVVNAFCNFLRQVSYPDTLKVSLYVANMGRSSFDTFNVIESVHQPGVICATGGATVVWSHYANQKSAPLPDWLKTALN